MKNRSEIVETIAAQATPPGRGGVGIIRVSGPLVPSIVQAILDKNISARYASFCDFLNGDKTIIDQGLAIYFSAPHSFTGEEVLELQGHGGQVVMDLLLRRALELGARLARPGEFMERAFLNHKLDLVQAEAVADLINAASSQAAQNAIRSLQGEFSKKINHLVGLLIKLRSNIEAMIDFTEEGEIEKLNHVIYADNVSNILAQMKTVKEIAKQGVILRDGMTVVITGNPNVGKSSLLNCLSGQDTAIVTAIPGTTRDVIRAWIQIDGLAVHVLDTAGLREHADLIEEEGIRRARAEIKKADHVLLMVDAAVAGDFNFSELKNKFLSDIPEYSNFTVLYNKIDLTGYGAKIVKIDGVDCIYLSTKTGEGIDLLRQHLKASIGHHAIEDGFSARRRHLEALERAEKYLQNIQDELLATNKIDLVAEELRQAQSALGEITGEVTVDDLLGKIFSEFCVGK